MEHTATYLGLIPLLPLIGALVIGLLHMFTCTKNPLPEKLYGALACIGPVLSFFLALVVFFHLKGLPPDEIDFSSTMPIPGLPSAICMSTWVFSPTRSVR